MKNNAQDLLNNAVVEVLGPESSIIPVEKALLIQLAATKMKYDAAERRRGQMYAFLTVLVIAAGTVYLVSSGHVVAGTIFSSSTSLAQIVNHFIVSPGRKAERIATDLKTLSRNGSDIPLSKQ